jgi:hypothetical protein
MPAERPAAAAPGGTESFRAVLAEHAASEQVVRLALPGGDMVMGKIAVVAEDHVEVSDPDQRRLIVPMYLILGVVRSSDHP